MVALGLAVLTACGGKGENEQSLRYLAIQASEGENWNIIDANGKTVVDREYVPGDIISKIYEDGQYWVKSGGKFHLFSIHSPKRPLTDEEYDNVTDFGDGRAFVSHIGSPIQMIDSKGKVIATLPKEVAYVTPFSDGRALYVSYVDRQERGGYLSTDGSIAIKAKYYRCSNFDGGFATVQEENGKWLIIDKHGKKTAGLEAETDAYSFSEGKAFVRRHDEEAFCYFVNSKGETVVKPQKHYRSAYPFKDGYSVVMDKDFNPALINEKGEAVIRTGKYKDLKNLGKGLFLAKSGQRWGVVDKEDNVLVECKYDGCAYFTLGDYFLLRNESAWVLVGKDGTELKGVDFHDFNRNSFPGVMFVDIQAAVDEFIAPCTLAGFAPFNGKISVADIAAQYGMDAKDFSYKRDMELPSAKAGQWDVGITVTFCERLTERKSHKEVVNDGWFSREITVDDGLGWNESAEVETVYQVLHVTDVKPSDVEKAAGHALVAKGFKAVGDAPVYEAKRDDGKYVRITMNSSETMLTLKYSPGFDHSEEDVDYD